MVLDDEIGQPDTRQIERLPPDGVLELESVAWDA